MKNISHLLVENNIVKTNFNAPFIWTSGIKSPIYCDCRELIALPEARELVTNAMIEQIKSLDLQPDIIAGTATAGIPWAAFVADKMNLPMLYVRSKPKGHGAGKMVEGRGEQNKNITIVEDAFSTGGSSIKSAEALKNELDANVTDIMGIFTWSTPLADTNAKEANLNLHPLTNFHEITDALLEAGTITEKEKESLENFHKDPAGWWKE